MKTQAKSPLLLVALNVSAAELVVASCDGGTQQPSVQTHPNTAIGQRRLLRELASRGERIRVALESTGVYGLAVALHLQSHPRIEIMIVNPRAIKDYIRATMTQAKTDRVDALASLITCAGCPLCPGLRLPLTSCGNRGQA